MSSLTSSHSGAVKYTGDALAALLFAITCFQIWFCFGDVSWYDENGLFELSQDAFLAAGAVLFFADAVLAVDRVSRLALLALTLFCLSILFREIDVRGTNLDPYLNYAFQHRWHYVFLGCLWIAVVALSARHFRLSCLYMLRLLAGLTGALLLAGIFFYVMGDFAEKHFFTGNVDVSEMVEESMEQLGTFFLCLSAWATCRRHWQ